MRLTIHLITISIFLIGLTSCSGGGGTTEVPVDSDSDGVVDSDDAFPNDGNEDTDTDGDGIGNNADTDDDGDGVPDDQDANPLDTDNDGLDNDIDDDDDEDGVPDVDDAFPLDSAESMDSDGDGIGDNADTDNSTNNGDGTGNSVDTITTANNDGQSFQCISDTTANGVAFFDATFTGTLNADYNIQDNSIGCGSSNLFSITSYPINIQAPDPGDPAGGDLLLTIDVQAAGGTPVMVADLPVTAMMTFPLSENPDRGGFFNGQNCQLSITAVTQMSDQTGGALFFPEGGLTCERFVLDSTTALLTGPQADIVPEPVGSAILFRTAVAVIMLP